MKEMGLLQRFQAKWLQKRDEEFWVSDAPSLGYENVMFPFLVTGVGALLAIAVSFLENLRASMNRPK